MVLPGIALQIDIEVGIAAVERPTIVLLGDRGLLPGDRGHRSVKRALAARTSRLGPAADVRGVRARAGIAFAKLSRSAAAMSASACGSRLPGCSP